MNDAQDGTPDGKSASPNTVAATRARTERIRELNDQFRRTLRGGKVFVTAGVSALGPDKGLAILRRVTQFDTFTPDNDPHEEHDFGAFEEGGERIMWKIDYFDELLVHGSDDPADPTRTCRILTVMLASEY